MPRSLTRSQLIIIGTALLASIGAGACSFGEAGAILTFVLSGVALSMLAAAVGEGTDQLGSYLGPAATGILQAALGNLPELFVAIFALRAGLVTVVQTSLIGSILGNSLFVLGAAFIVGSWGKGKMEFKAHAPRLIATITLLATAALILPTLAAELHLPAEHAELPLSVVCAAVLLVVFAASIPVMLRESAQAQTQGGGGGGEEEGKERWPIGLAVAVLGLASVAAAFVSDWFVEALQPAMERLGITQAFAGLVIVALAGNAVEHVAGVQLAAKGKADHAVAVILNSSLQIAVALIPLLVLVSFFFGTQPFVLAVPPMLAVAVALTVLLVTFITYDGEADMAEGAALVGLYVIIAAIFWWG